VTYMLLLNCALKLVEEIILERELGLEITEEIEKCQKIKKEKKCILMCTFLTKTKDFLV